MILVDTHVLIWLKAEPSRLSTAASDAIRAARENDGVAISAITLWEIAWLATHHRLDFSGAVDAVVEEMSSRIAVRPITSRIAVLANQLPPTYPSDPCDRLIGATAMAEGLALVTKDRSIRNCKQVTCIW
jgi:PIN domain nuclease of toxin-antitoxin system